jgi:hypothetical protein
MKRSALLALLALSTVSLAQTDNAGPDEETVEYSEVFDSGTIVEYDEFTNEKTCYRMAENTADAHRTSLSLGVNDSGPSLYIHRNDLPSDGLGHNMFGSMSDDALLIKLGEETRSFPLELAESDYEEGASLEMNSVVAVEISLPYVKQLVAQTEDMRFRISSSGTSAEGTITHEQLKVFKNFLAECEAG